MAVSATTSSTAVGTLLLADISGYTGFLQGVADAHRAIIIEADEPPAAYGLVSSLLDTIVTSIAPPFRLAKFEGDAVFAVASDTELTLRGMDMVACLRACHDAFRAQLDQANSQWNCTCAACSRVSQLGLKFILHHGAYVVQHIAGHEELLGPQVNIAHRLLKNHAFELIGARPYALMTDAFLLGRDVPFDGMLATVETYDDAPPIPAHVLPLA